MEQGFEVRLGLTSPNSVLAANAAATWRYEADTAAKPNKQYCNATTHDRLPAMDSGRPYFPRLDGIRAVAISMVVIQHFAPSPWLQGLGLGGIGVQLFFVLSGFLITRILLGYRDSGATLSTAAVAFYGRRILRLAPAYYLAIAGALILGLGNINQAWVTDALCLANLRAVMQHSWDGSTHFWSLSVEEQFYLLWFGAVMLVPPRGLPTIARMAVVGAPLFRVLVVALTGNTTAAIILLPGCVDALGAGALLAMGGPEWRGRLNCAPLLVLAVGAVVATYTLSGIIAFTLQPLAVECAGVVLIATAIDARRNALVEWLNWKPLRHIGRISYGIYVYHYFVREVPAAWLPDWHLSPWGGFVVEVAASLVIAEVSWYAIERPLLSLKRRPRLSVVNAAA